MATTTDGVLFPGGVSLVSYRADTDDQARVQRAVGGGTHVAGRGLMVDELFYNEDQTMLAGTWVVRDVSSTSTFATDDPRYWRRCKKSTEADEPGCLGVILNTALSGNWVIVRRQGVIDQNLDGFKANITSVGAAPVRLQLSATDGNAEAAGSDTENCIGVTISGETAIEVRCLGA